MITKEQMLNTKTLVIKLPFGGLGDHLWCSHLPRIAKQTGVYHKVYISNKSELRSENYKKYIWELNPYIDGFTDEDAWHPEIGDLDDGMNILDRMMLEYNMDDNLRFHEPEFYFVPAIREDLKDKNIYDPNYISYTGKIGIKNLHRFFKTCPQPPDFQMKMLGSKGFPLTNVPVLQAGSFEDYCSIIISCKTFYALTSGGATLAPALGKQCNVLYGEKHKKKFRHSNLCTYIFIKTDKTAFIVRVFRKLKTLLKVQSGRQ